MLIISLDHVPYLSFLIINIIVVLIISLPCLIEYVAASLCSCHCFLINSSSCSFRRCLSTQITSFSFCVAVISFNSQISSQVLFVNFYRSGVLVVTMLSLILTVIAWEFLIVSTQSCYHVFVLMSKYVLDTRLQHQSESFATCDNSSFSIFVFSRYGFYNAVPVSFYQFIILLECC